MATATLSLFPSPSLKHKTSQKGNLRYGQRSAKEPDFEMIKMSDSTQAIVVAVQERPAPKEPEERKIARLTPEQHDLPSIVLSSPPKLRDASRQSPSASIRPRTPSPPALSVQSTPAPATPIKSPLRSQPPSPLRPEGSPRSRASSPTLVRKGSNASTRTATHSPIMRSMFPRYDPSIPLNRQHYYPSTESGSNIPAQLYNSSITSQQNRQSSRPSAPTLVIPTSSGAVPILQRTSSERTPPTFSKPDELLQLWDVANGQSQDGAEEVFRLELGCDSLCAGSETISFSSTSQNLYTLSASATTLAISRTHPQHPTPTIPICKTTLCTPTPTSPLLATIFPSLAELMALDQSSTIAATHRLPRATSTSLQAEAISRAQQNEASNLLWDSDSGNYYLIHPTLLDNASTTFPISITPSSLNAEKIVFAAPETGGRTPLLVLDLSSKKLSVYAGPVKALPSLYVLDTLITGMLVLLLHLHRSSSSSSSSNTAAATTAQDPTITFPPPPTLLTLTSRRPKRSLSTWSRSVFSRHPHPQRPLINNNNDLEIGQPSREEEAKEHDFTFQPLVNADDESLPAATRAVLRAVYWAFQVMVWVLGLGVNLVAAGVVAVGRVGGRG
ncbi:MAG: hypothetical protein HETSPECPRED_009498 [Heterodermia speciosa]|uniref:Uncharacterized protein n=1 Tax=Heterodermia speciosa TaxID=116794 RepID=A0A8H3EVM8_9LECA|nr:MAG: hypothetical protein HETSPECPRED_009498 [Heterodermia speciosa]